MGVLTFVIPVGPGHEATAERAVASCYAQTLPCDILTYIDDAGRGPGWARNRGLEQVRTEFVSFLDADDWLDSTFAEACLTHFRAHPNRYVYTDHWQGDRRVDAPECPWFNRTWHPVTTLLPTHWCREVGGFDERLPGAEDTDFYLKLMMRGFCGQRLAQPLFHYSADGARGSAFVRSPAHDDTMRIITQRYGGRHMACCGGAEAPMQPEGDRAENDVLCQALWGGNRTVIGQKTGRAYPRTGNGKLVWVDPRDAEAMGHMFRRHTLVSPPVNNGVNPVRQVANAMLAIQRDPPPSYPPAAPAAVKPDFDGLLAHVHGQDAAGFPIDALTLDIIRPFITSTSVCVDVGAGDIGFYCVAFAEWGQKTYVIEPLVSGALRTAIKGKKITLIEAALATETGRAPFYISSADANTSSLKRDWWGVFQHDTTEVKTISYADLCKRLKRAPDVLKLDIEGSERDVLPDVAKQPPQVLVFEWGGGDTKRTGAGGWQVEAMRQSQIAWDALIAAGYTHAALLDPAYKTVRRFAPVQQPDYAALFGPESGFGNLVLWR